MLLSIFTHVGSCLFTRALLFTPYGLLRHLSIFTAIHVICVRAQWSVQDYPSTLPVFRHFIPHWLGLPPHGGPTHIIPACSSAIVTLVCLHAICYTHTHTAFATTIYCPNYPAPPAHYTRPLGCP